jgi:hypothetical protein
LRHTALVLPSLRAAASTAAPILRRLSAAERGASSARRVRAQIRVPAQVRKSLLVNASPAIDFR